MSHTPGPWRAAIYLEDGDYGPHSAVIRAVDSIAGMRNAQNYDRDEFSANARLIAAAPSLLEFCVALRDRYNTDDRLGGLGDWLRNVIAEATGEAVPS